MSDSDDDSAYDPSPVKPHPPNDPFGWGRLPPRGGGGLGSGGDDDEEERIRAHLILALIHHFTKLHTARRCKRRSKVSQN